MNIGTTRHDDFPSHKKRFLSSNRDRWSAFGSPLAHSWEVNLSQNEAILFRLKRGEVLTAFDALNDPDIRSFRLAARIKDLKQQGHDIETVRTETSRGVYVAAYKLRTRVESNGQRVMAI